MRVVAGLVANFRRDLRGSRAGIFFGIASMKKVDVALEGLGVRLKFGSKARFGVGWKTRNCRAPRRRSKEFWSGWPAGDVAE